MSKRRKLEGIASPGDGRYDSSSTQVESLADKIWRPVSGTNLDTDSIIHFQLETNANEIVRFGDSPFFLLFTAIYPNPAKDAAKGADTEEGSAFHYLLPQGVKEDKPLPPVYFEPTLQAQSLFSKIEVWVNGEPVEGPQMSNYCSIYTGVNRIHAKEQLLEERYGLKIWRISTSMERLIVEHEASDRMYKAMRTLQFDGKIKSKHLLSTFNFDGWFPFAMQSNLTRAIFGKKIQNGFLPPKITLRLAMHKRVPLDSALERPNITDEVYHDVQTAADAQPRVTFKMKDLFLVYESAVLEGRRAASYKTATYYVDIPNVRWQHVAAGMSHTVNTVMLPKGTKVAVLLWMPMEQLDYNAASNKNVSNRFTYLPNNTNATCKLKGREVPLIFSGGLVNLGVKEAFNSPSCRAYHAWLLRKGLYGRDLLSMFPQAGLSYDQTILLDLSDHDTRQPQELEVHLEFDSNFSPNKHHMVVITLQQGRYTYHDKQPLKLEYVS